jgi:hypothetical protein
MWIIVDRQSIHNDKTFFFSILKYFLTKRMFSPVIERPPRRSMTFYAWWIEKMDGTKKWRCTGNLNTLFIQCKETA